jgi:hypothetical protein
MKAKILFVMILAFATSAGVQAQTFKGGAGFLKVGYANHTGSALVLNEITPEGMTGFSNSFYGVGAEGYFRTGRAIIALEGSVGAQNRQSVGNKYGEAYAGTGHARFGWVILEGTQYWLYPSIGSGSAVLGITTYDKVNGENENLRNTLLYTPSLDIGLNGDFLTGKVTEGSNRFGGLLLGLRAGYHLSPKSNNWRDEDWNRVRNFPNYNNRGFYVSLTVGGGGFRRK